MGHRGTGAPAHRRLTSCAWGTCPVWGRGQQRRMPRFSRHRRRRTRPVRGGGTGSRTRAPPAVEAKPRKWAGRDNFWLRVGAVVPAANGTAKETLHSKEIGSPAARSAGGPPGREGAATLLFRFRQFSSLAQVAVRKKRSLHYRRALGPRYVRALHGPHNTGPPAPLAGYVVLPPPDGPAVSTAESEMVARWGQAPRRY